MRGRKIFIEEREKNLGPGWAGRVSPVAGRDPDSHKVSPQRAQASFYRRMDILRLIVRLSVTRDSSMSYLTSGKEVGEVR